MELDGHQDPIPKRTPSGGAFFPLAGVTGGNGGG